MAKLNGVEIKALKQFVGHDGECSQGNVYIDGKKAGFWSQDAWGGPDSYDGGFEKSLAERAKMMQAGTPRSSKFYDIMNDSDVFMGALLTLLLDEKEYKKVKKAGFGTMLLVTDGYHVNGMAYKGALTLADIEQKHPGTIERLSKGMFENKKPVIRLYSSSEDFNVRVDANHPAPEWIYM